MKNTKFIRTSAIAGSVSLATVLSSTAATTLIGPGDANDTPVVFNHGSAQAGTANINLNWSAGWESYSNWNSQGDDVFQLDQANAGATFTVMFTPDAGFQAIVNNTEMFVWTGSGGDFVINWDISGTTSGSLGSAQITLADGSARTPVNFGDLTGADGEALTLTMTMDASSAGNGGYLAMDNLTFDQVAVAAVPEPSSSLLAAVGIGAMAMRRRRK